VRYAGTFAAGETLWSPFQIDPEKGPCDVSAPYPRVLLVNVQPISRRYATGITMGNLFRGWPLDRIAQIYCDDSEPDETVCPHSWRLEVEDAPMPRWLRPRVASQKGTHSVAPRGATASGTQGPQTEMSFRGRVGRAAKTAFLRYATYAPYSIPPEIRSGVAGFRPDIIYSSLEDRRITGVALDFARRLSLPLVPHFMDDWMTKAASPRSGCLENWARRDFERKALRVLHDAPVRLVIGGSMADAYERRYGYQFLPFMNCVDLDERPVVRSRENSGRAFRFGFAGALHHGRADTLTDIIDAIESLSAEGVEAEVVIYQHRADEALPHTILRAPLVRLADAREEALLETADCEIDAFLHVDTFEEPARKYLQYSMSAKLPWYLAAGVPIFAYGAPELGTMRYFCEQRCAAVVDQRDQELLRSRLRSFVNDSTVRRTLGAKARLVAQKHFDARVQRDAFRRVLRRYAGSDACLGSRPTSCTQSSRGPA